MEIALYLLLAIADHRNSCSPGAMLDALRLADREFVHDPNDAMGGQLLITPAVFFTDNRTPAQKLRADADAIEAKSGAARRIRHVLKSCDGWIIR